MPACPAIADAGVDVGLAAIGIVVVAIAIAPAAGGDLTYAAHASMLSDIGKAARLSAGPTVLDFRLGVDLTPVARNPVTISPPTGAGSHGTLALEATMLGHLCQHALTVAFTTVARISVQIPLAAVIVVCVTVPVAVLA